MTGSVLSGLNDFLFIVVWEKLPTNGNKEKKTRKPVKVTTLTTDFLVF